MSRRYQSRMWAVVRVNLYQLEPLPGEDVSGWARAVFHVKEVTADEGLAEQEAERLNKENGKKDVYYFVDLARVLESPSDDATSDVDDSQP